MRKKNEEEEEELLTCNYVEKRWRGKNWRTFTDKYFPNESFRVVVLLMSLSFFFLGISIPYLPNPVHAQEIKE